MPSSADGSTGAGLRVHAMRDEDLAQVLVIERASFPATSAWKRAHFLHEMHANPYAFNRVLREGRRVLGYASLWCLDDELRINNLAVREDARGRGLGRKLLDAILREARELGCTRATLEVRPSNVAALALYRSAGFVEVGCRKNYYALEREDAILMDRSLAGEESP